MDTTYGMACPVCVWMVDNRPTTEHVEREYLAHVRAQHPENVERVGADALAGECRARFISDAILTPSGYQSTCRTCGATMTATDVRVIDDWPAVHILARRPIAPTVVPRRDERIGNP
jgi:hypothetical protein